MKRGSTDAETCALNGWTVGTHVRGHEMWADGVGVWSTWRITAIGEDCVLVKGVRRDYTGTMWVFGLDRPEGLAGTALRCRAEGYEVPEPDHTAEGDVRTTRAVYEALRAIRGTS